MIIDGVDIANYSQKELTTYRRNDVGFVFQFYNLVPNLTAKENVELASEIVADARDAVQTLIDVGLGKRLNNFPAQLSGGEQQRNNVFLLEMLCYRIRKFSSLMSQQAVLITSIC